MHLDQIIGVGIESPQETHPDPVKDRLPRRQVVTRAKDNLPFGNMLAHPTRERRAAGGIIRTDKAVPLHIAGDRRHAVLLNIIAAAVDPELQAQEGLNNIVRLAGRAACADCNMRLAVLKPKQSRAGEVAQDDVGIIFLELRQHRDQKLCYSADGCDHQLAGHIISASPDPPGQLAELIVRRLRDAQQILPCLCRRVSTRMSLEQLDAESPLQRIDMTDHRCMMNPQHIGSP